MVQAMVKLYGFSCETRVSRLLLRYWRRGDAASHKTGTILYTLNILLQLERHKAYVKNSELSGDPPFCRVQLSRTQIASHIT